MLNTNGILAGVVELANRLGGYGISVRLNHVGDHWIYRFEYRGAAVNITYERLENDIRLSGVDEVVRVIDQGFAQFNLAM